MNLLVLKKLLLEQELLLLLMLLELQLWLRLLYREQQRAQPGEATQADARNGVEEGVLRWLQGLHWRRGRRGLWRQQPHLAQVAQRGQILGAHVVRRQELALIREEFSNCLLLGP